MGKIAVVSDDLKEELDDEAEALDMSRAQYVRQMLYAGRTLFQSSGKLDTRMLRELIDDERTVTETSVADTDDLEETILEILPADKGRALDREMVRQDVFGTVDEQQERIDDLLEILEERGDISFDIDGNVYKHQ